MQTSTQAVRARTDEPFLERFIEAHEAFVLRCASRHAGFAVTRSDDEYSVALLAFYEAIKGYDPASGPFGAYASLVIGRRLADHYRSQHRFDAETPLAPQTFDGTVDRESADAAMQQAVAEQMSEAKPVSAQEEIEAANTVFEKYGFALMIKRQTRPSRTRRAAAAPRRSARCCIRRCCSRPCRARTACPSRRSRSSAACPRGRSPVTGITL